MKTRRLLLVGVLITLFLAACDGCSSGGDGPADVVKKAVEALERYEEDRASEYFCKDYKNQIKDAFADTSEYLGLMVDVKKVLKFQFKDMKYEERSREGDKAVVHFAGLAKAEFNADKYKEVARDEIEAAEGETISDEDLELLDLFANFFMVLNQEKELDGDVTLIKEDGKWRVCDDFSKVFDFDWTP